MSPPTKRIKQEPGTAEATPSEHNETTEANGGTDEARPKPEPADPITTQEIEETIMKLVEGQKEGINESIMKVAMPFVTPAQRVNAINKLLSKGKIEILKQGGTLVYRYVNQDKTKGCDKDERVVFQVIERAGNKGIWVRDIRSFSGLVLPQLNKVLKNLESKKLIKVVKSVSAAKKRLYMLYELEPDRSVTGGAWYSGQEFESEFVEILQQQCYRFLAHKGKTAAEKYQDDMVNMRNNSVASTKEVWGFIKQLGISKVELDVEDINVILGTLCFQGKVVRSVSSEKIKDSNEYLCLWSALDCLYQSPMAICNIACGRCPVRHDCSIHGVRNPLKCEYTAEFLKDIEDLENNPSEEMDPSGPICDALLDY